MADSSSNKTLVIVLAVATAVISPIVAIVWSQNASSTAAAPSPPGSAADQPPPFAAPSAAATPPRTDDAPELKVFKKSTDGTFQLMVEAINQRSRIGDDIGYSAAGKGWRFVIVDAALANETSGPETYLFDRIQLVDDEGKRYGLDEDQQVRYGGSLMATVGPDIAQRVRLFFYVPDDRLLVAAFDTTTGIRIRIPDPKDLKKPKHKRSD